MSKLIITVIGGGSVNWMIKLMRDFYLLDSVSEGEIRLVDPRVHHAEAVAAMADELLFANRFWLDRFFADGDPGFVDASEAFSPRG